MDTIELMAHDSTEIFEFTLAHCLDVAGTGQGSVHLMDWRTGELRICAQRGLTKEFLAFFQVVRLSDGGACARVLRDRGTVIIEDVILDADSPQWRDVMLAAGLRAVQLTPLISKSGAFIGIMSTYFGAPHRPGAEERQSLETVGESLANAIIWQRARAADRDHDDDQGEFLVETARAAVDDSCDLLRRVDRQLRRWVRL